MNVLVGVVAALGSASVDLSGLKKDEAEIILEVMRLIDGMPEVVIKLVKIVAEKAE